MVTSLVIAAAVSELGPVNSRLTTAATEEMMVAEQLSRTETWRLLAGELLKG